MKPSTRIATMGVAVASTIVLGGCASVLSGVGGTEGYACKAPIGAQCTSVSGVYANANGSANANANTSANSDLLDLRTMHEAHRPQGVLATQFIPVATLETAPAASAETSPVLPSGAPAGATASPTTQALRSPPRVLRLWISPWEDADGDLHEASFINVVIDTGRWLIERVRPAPRSHLDIATPPLAASSSPTVIRETSPAADLAPIEP